MFYVEVLDSDKNVVFSEYHSGTVFPLGNSAVRTFTPTDPAGTFGRYARLRYADTLTDCLHIAELEGEQLPNSVAGNLTCTLL